MCQSEITDGTVARIIHSLPGSISMPAGAGKTEIVAAVSASVAENGDTILILTHTHAGVEALRRRMSKFNVPQGQVSIRTIDAWCFDLIQHFPLLADYAVPGHPDWNDSQEYHRAAARAVISTAVQRMLRISYSLVIVDEYQDCLIDQHQVIIGIQQAVPTLVLGDPLQGLFDFQGQQPVEWGTDVLRVFPSVYLEPFPWRWHGHNEALGQWLLAIREPLICGMPVDLRGSPILWSRRPSDRQEAMLVQVATCFNAPRNGSTVALGRFRNDILTPASRLRGTFSVMEALDSSYTQEFCTLVDSGGPFEVAQRAVEFAVECTVGVAEHIPAQARRRLGEGQRIATRKADRKAAYDALNALLESAAPQSVRKAMDAMLALPGVSLYCREAWHEVTQALQIAAPEEEEPVTTALQLCRNRTRAMGRRPAPRTLSRPLLVKGLEYDHAILLNADEYNAHELYVALTRASKSVTVISSSPILNPVGNS